MSKLKNIEAIRKMLDGSHRTQTRKVFGWSRTKDTKVRKVGEIWEEVDLSGNIKVWEQKRGYRVLLDRNSEIIREVLSDLFNYDRCYDNCEKKITKEYSRLDKKFSVLRNMCFDCLVKYEAKLKMEGKYDDYVKEIKKKNAEAFFKDKDSELVESIEALKNLKFVNSSGEVESWDMDSRENFINQLVDKYEEYKKIVLESFKE